ncbi:MAG: DNA-directed RNA polymerase subunit omega [Actinomycetia bacterium]|nr:DNA-directed RNA polymerase subunit omega [Actinomycetes bacterium]
MSVSQPEIDQLLDQVDSKFTLCILSSKRARQINDMIHGVRDQALQAMATSEIAKLTSAKPLSLAMDEIAQGDVLPDEMRTTEEDDPVLEAPEAESPESEALLG